VQIGFGAPLSGPLSDPESLTRIAVAGEEMGYDYMTFSDHVVIPTDIQARYPYSDTGEFPQGSRGRRYEQLTTLAYVAAKTSRLRLVTSVMVVPHRPAVLTAKILATIDVLSGGRLVVGVGAGWLAEEFAALATPPFAERGAVTDEYLEAFKALWTEDAPRFAGKHVQFADIVFDPKPLQRPHPPIWIGGESGPALRRTAKLGDGWYPIGTNPQFPLNSLPRLRQGIERVRKLVGEAGRDPSAVTISYRVQKYGESVPALASDGERHLFAGSAAAIAADLAAMRELGIGHVDLTFPGDTTAEIMATMQRFRQEVVGNLH
jgi:probable F420-dependent oxidoreductase